MFTFVFVDIFSLAQCFEKTFARIADKFFIKLDSTKSPATRELQIVTMTAGEDEPFELIDSSEIHSATELNFVDEFGFVVVDSHDVQLEFWNQENGSRKKGPFFSLRLLGAETFTSDCSATWQLSTHQQEARPAGDCEFIENKMYSDEHSYAFDVPCVKPSERRMHPCLTSTCPADFFSILDNSDQFPLQLISKGTVSPAHWHSGSNSNDSYVLQEDDDDLHDKVVPFEHLTSLEGRGGNKRVRLMKNRTAARKGKTLRSPKYAK